MAKFRTSLSIFGLASAASEAFGVKVNGDTDPRVKIDAGGRISWGTGSGAGDVWLSRTAAETLTINKVLVVSGGVVTLAGAGDPTAPLADGGLAVDTTADRLNYRSNGAWLGLPVVAGDPMTFDISGAVDRQLLQFDSAAGKWVDGVRISYGDTPPSSPGVGDIWLDTNE